MGLTVSDTISKRAMRSTFKNNDSAAYGVVKVLVTRFLNSFAFNTKIDAQQVEILTVDTLEKFAYESLEDVILFFKLGRTGHFGTAKKGIDGNLLFSDWLPKYLEQKAEERERQIEAEKAAQKNKPTTMDDVRKTYAKVAKVNYQKAQTQKVQDYINKITEPMDRQMLEDTILDWSKDPKKRLYLDLLKRKRRTIK